MLKQQTFNYITLTLALITIIMAIYTVTNENSRIPCAIMLAITVIFHFISKRFNEDSVKLKQEEREALALKRQENQEEKGEIK